MIHYLWIRREVQKTGIAINQAFWDSFWVNSVVGFGIYFKKYCQIKIVMLFEESYKSLETFRPRIKCNTHGC